VGRKKTAAHDSQRTPVAFEAARRGRPADESRINRSFAGTTDDAFGVAAAGNGVENHQLRSREKFTLSHHTPSLHF